MAYFSKDAYWNKKLYADKVAGESADAVADYILNQQGITDDNEDYEDLRDDLLEELEVLNKLSSERHEMHTSDSCDCFDKLGNQYTYGDCLIEQVNALNKKYDLVDSYLSMIAEPEATPDMSLEDLCEYYDIEYDEDNYHKILNRVTELLDDDWNRARDAASEEIRKWFGLLNEKTGSQYPSMSS